MALGESSSLFLLRWHLSMKPSRDKDKSRKYSRRVSIHCFLKWWALSDCHPFLLYGCPSSKVDVESYSEIKDKKEMPITAEGAISRRLFSH